MHSDVLIIGAGSAGSVLAEALSVNPSRRVTLIEAGPGPDIGAVAALIGDGTRLPLRPDSPVVRGYRGMLTEAPPRTVDLVRGAVVGGSGAVNGGYFCRGVPRDFDGWGLSGWSWAEVLEHFRAIETDLDFVGPLHGAAGPVPVRRAGELTGPAAVLAAAADAAGIGWLADLNGGDSGDGLPTGMGAVPSNIIDGHRYGPGEVFLSRAAGRSNLTVRQHISVHRIQFSGNRAVAVEVTGPAGPDVFTADRIVICAGAIGTARLLMLSGIGDPVRLRELGIETVLAAPVGENFSDHPEWVVPVPGAPAAPGSVLQAVLSLSSGIEIRPYQQGFAAMTGILATDDHPQIGVALMKPVSRGRIRLLSADPGIAPEIRYRYDRAPEDTVALASGVAVLREILGGAVELGEPAWSTSQHLCGTAPMGADDDARAVLDDQCRVRGLEGLWVIDGSALPEIPSRGPHATTVMFAHRAAEFVAAD